MLTPAALSLALALTQAAGDDPGCPTLDLSLAGIGSLQEELARVAGLTGAGPVRPGLIRRPSGERSLRLCGDEPRADDGQDRAPTPDLALELVPPQSLTRVLSTWADDRNDGALWAGRGLSSSLTAGVRARWRWFTAQLAPLGAWQMNRPFRVPQTTLPGYSPWANPFNNGEIDLPVRMGPSPFWTFTPGQSFLRADLGAFAAGLSSENLWWGPGIRNSLIMSNSAAGFPHLFVGTSRPVDIWIGWLEAEAIWGRLSESRWFQTDPTLQPGGDRRRFESIAYTFAPAFARHFTLGLARVWVYPSEEVGKDAWYNPILPAFVHISSPNGRNNGSENGLMSLFARWAIPEAQLELYGEWLRDDFVANLRGLAMDPWNASAFLGGLQKLVPWRGGWLRVQAEATHTYQAPEPSLGAPIVYTHGGDKHGYTNGGQMLGAGLGPQGDSQFLGVDWFTGAGRVGLFVERTLRNERFWADQVFPQKRDYLTHDAQMSYGARGAWAFREWDLSAELAAVHRYRLFFERAVGGVDLTLRAAWWPGRSQPPALPAPRLRGQGDPVR